ncbi:MAG TPA: zeta toxin family protein [Cyclobacteriaceae bacterium]|nr:zeta toxin family protein [Cyclobacteriaceae bacterium]HMV08387.1 zeta toxin family protein [Cyclobacteriaceae bacterium]HMV89686.1 zeta toxin family protein [Cyclobacteriaceae bacterium]HMX01160.1 zeta toxin family protein [Cyclobacteriaceae bacterium]HMX50563.1 zeta toxin family protein [Cyclobacteriaceae bacterium]
MPTLHILAGPNGAGKTTFYETAVNEGFIEKQLPFVNVDLIARSFGSYSAENFQRADNEARLQIGTYLNAMHDFMIESNLSMQNDYDWVQAVAKKGYEVVIYFLYTCDVSVNINRVKKRVSEGGHDIPQPIIEHRYKTGLSYLKSNLHKFKRVLLIDTSEDTAIFMAEIQAGKIVFEEQNTPAWVSEALFISRRLNK